MELLQLAHVIDGELNVPFDVHVSEISTVDTHDATADLLHFRENREKNNI